MKADRNSCVPRLAPSSEAGADCGQTCVRAAFACARQKRLADVIKPLSHLGQGRVCAIQSRLVGMDRDFGVDDANRSVLLISYKPTALLGETVGMLC